MLYQYDYILDIKNWLATRSKFVKKLTRSNKVTKNDGSS